ncbi:hypothetical protein EVAR_34411_1 [Eumeta japonica]|uniref:Uncharacterized protein n=1 Tax=Eumeta variegata TaxID=151549 RepID=A0A4C1WZW2_EUMVA|nr:hypothetical protein EVAR_34411_1 [Eumeta japonica]
MAGRQILFSWHSITASLNAAGQHTEMPTTCDMPYGRFLEESPRHTMSLNTDTGRIDAHSRNHPTPLRRT